MDTPTAGVLLREVARLHVHSQREQVACCNGTTSTQCLILTEVARFGPMTLADLGRRTSLDKGWLSRAVETLVQQGLLTKALGDADRRTIRIALSPAGETRYMQLNETLDAHAQRVMACIPLHMHLLGFTRLFKRKSQQQQAYHLVRRDIDEFLDHAPCNTTRLAKDCSLVGDG